jgi:hypothetical protein
VLRATGRQCSLVRSRLSSRGSISIMSFAQRKCLRLSASPLVQILRVLHGLSKVAFDAPLLDYSLCVSDQPRSILCVLEEPIFGQR